MENFVSQLVDLLQHFSSSSMLRVNIPTVSSTRSYNTFQQKSTLHVPLTPLPKLLVRSLPQPHPTSLSTHPAVEPACGSGPWIVRAAGPR